MVIRTGLLVLLKGSVRVAIFWSAPRMEIMGRLSSNEDIA